MALKAAVLVAYQAFWDAYIDYGGRTGAFDPAEARAFLGAHMTGDEYTKVFNYFQLNRLKGLVLRGRPESAPHLDVTIDADDRATVKDCLADTGGIYKASTSERVDQQTAGRKLFVAQIVLDGGRWKVSLLKGQGQCSL